jgi:hypothetical protein
MISCSGEVLFKLFRLLTAQAGSNLVIICTIAIFKKSTYQHSIFAFAGYEKRRSVSVHQAPLLSMLKV